MAPPIRQHNLPPLDVCRDAVQRAVAIKLNTSSSYKLTAEAALEMAGIERSVASNSSMLSRFRRLYKSKLKELQGAEPSAALKPPPPPVASTKKAPPKKTGTVVPAAAPPAATAAPPPPSVRLPSPLKKAASATGSSKRPPRRRPPLFSKNFCPKTPKELQAAFARQQRQREKESHAMSVATKRYLEEKPKPKEGRISARKIVQEVNDEFGTNISFRTMARYVQNGFVGQGLKKGGRPPYKQQTK